MISGKNLLPALSEWSLKGDAASTAVFSDNGSTVTWTAVESETYIRYEIKNVSAMVGNMYVFGGKLYSCEDGLGRIIVRYYDSAGEEHELIEQQKITEKIDFECIFVVPADCIKLRIAFKHEYGLSFNRTVLKAASPYLIEAPEGYMPNLLPEISEVSWNIYIAKEKIVRMDGRSIEWKTTTYGDFVMYEMDGDFVAGKTFEIGAENFMSSPNEDFTKFSVRIYTDDSTYEYHPNGNLYGIEGPFSVTLSFPSTVYKARIYFWPTNKHGSEFEEQIFSLQDYFMYEVYQPGQPVTFHKILKPHLPSSALKDCLMHTHIYFARDGSNVGMYISDKDGMLLPVAGGASISSEYTNSYTMAYIEERKEEIIHLTRQGNCIVFAVATDIHVREKDGTAGRYDQVRDLLLLAENLPIDYICCTGDIISDSKPWKDKAFEPRLEAVKSIFAKLRCSWFAVRGNHDFNSINHTTDSVEVTVDNANEMMITNKDWYRAVTSATPHSNDFRIEFDESNRNGGYFYVDDYARKHRMIFINSNETREDTYGRPYINSEGSLECFLYYMKSKQQIEWITGQAMNMSGKTEWTVSFFSHVSPYCDTDEEGGCSEFHGYGFNNPPLIQLVHAFKNGKDINITYDVCNLETQKWESYVINKSFSSQGAIAVTGWYSGHIHDDCYRKVNDINMCVSTCTSGSQRTDYAHDPTPVKLPPARNYVDLAMSVNVFIINTDTRTVNVVKVGSKRDNTVKTSSDYEFTY